jgi:hypothetical protein
LQCLPGVNLDVRLGVEFLGTEPALEAVGRHLVGLVHVGLQLGRRIFLNKGEESLKSTGMQCCRSVTFCYGSGSAPLTNGSGSRSCYCRQ